MSRELMYFLQLLGAVSAGGFIGEFYRSATSPVSMRIFMANFLAGGFLSFLIAYIFYHFSNQKQLSLALGGILSYQEENYINRLSRVIIRELTTKGEKDK